MEGYWHAQRHNVKSLMGTAYKYNNKMCMCMRMYFTHTHIHTIQENEMIMGHFRIHILCAMRINLLSEILHISK